MIYFVLVALATPSPPIDATVTAEGSFCIDACCPETAIPKLIFGPDDRFGNGITVMQNKSKLTCSGEFEAADLRIAGTSTTVADLIQEVATLKGQVAQILQMLTPPPTSPPAPPALPPAPWSVHAQGKWCDAALIERVCGKSVAGELDTISWSGGCGCSYNHAVPSRERCQQRCSDNPACNFYLYKATETSCIDFDCSLFSDCISMITFGDTAQPSDVVIYAKP